MGLLRHGRMWIFKELIISSPLLITWYMDKLGQAKIQPFNLNHLCKNQHLVYY